MHSYKQDLLTKVAGYSKFSKNLFDTVDSDKDDDEIFDEMVKEFSESQNLP